MNRKPTKEQLIVLRDFFQKGSRVRIVSMDDNYRPPRFGTEGEVIEVDDAGAIHIQWDNSSSLNSYYHEIEDEPSCGVVTICYGKKREWSSRNEAIAFYVDCMLHSEGAEQERYLEIYLDLMAGKTLCLDEKPAKK